MKRQRVLLLALALAPLAFLRPAAWAQDAHGNHNFYIFLVGVAPLEGPDVATAPNGNTISLTGMGTFQAGPGKSASGGGSYTLLDSAGNTIASGAWSVIRVLGFVDYGNATPEGLPASFHGGEAAIAVSFSGIGGGVLIVECLLGSPPAGKAEGIKLILRQELNFTNSTSGQTLFIRP